MSDETSAGGASGASDVPERLAAALSDRYRVERELGQGGMATVYLAADLRHDRNVAIKVLRPELAAVVGGDRFISEIRTTANLQHPHILPLFDSGEADGFLWYAMPYIEGETLRERLDREKQLPVGEAVAIAVKIAGALQTAHDQGIIHRDIKPANILLANGEPLVADFGIALAVQEAGGGRLTETGLSVGTPYYMSPEQATADRDPDARSDLYSLACMVWEMLAGDPPFKGGTAQAVLGQILTQPAPSVSGVRSSVPSNVDAALLQALQKLPADRFESVGEFAAALRNESYMGPAARASGTYAAASPLPRGAARWLPWGVAAGAVAIALSSMVLGGRRAATPEAPQPLRFALEDRVDWFGAARSLAVSADGSAIAYQDLVDGRPVWIRRDLGEMTSRPIPESDGALYAAISPDGRWIAYDSGEDSLMYRSQSSSTRPVVMAHPPNPPMGLTWLSDDRVLGGMPWYDGDFTSGVLTTAISDSTLASLSDPPEGMHHEPYALSDGRHALVIDFGDSNGLAVFDTESGDWERLDLGDVEILSWLGLVGVSDDVLLFREIGGRLMAIRWNPDRLETEGVAVPVPGVDGAVQDAVMSHEGTLVMVFEPSTHVPAIVDDRGAVVRRLPVDSVGQFFHPRVGPNSDLIWMLGGEERNYREWLVDLRTATVRDFRIGDRARDWVPAVGDWIAPDRFVAPDHLDVDGPDPSLLLSRSARPEVVGESRILPDSVEVDHLAISPDGSWAAGVWGGFRTATEIRVLSLETGEMRPFVGLGAASMYAPAISPDGTRMAFVSETAGRPEVFLTAFPEEGEVSRVSEGRSGQPVWDPSGETLYYLTPTGLVAADLSFDQTGVATVTDRRALFDLPMFGTASDAMQTYDIHPDGFVVGLEEGGQSGRIVVWKNWIHELEPLLGGS